MDETQRRMLFNVIDALESFWLENLAMHYLLEHYGPRNWLDLVLEYRDRESSKDLARKRFAPVRALIQQAESESEVLETLLPLIPGHGKPN